MRLYHFIRGLIEPDPGLTDPLQRQRARIISLILLLWLVSTFIIYIVWAITAPQLFEGSRVFTAIFAYLILIPLFYISRTRYYRIAAWLFVISGIFINILGYYALDTAVGEDPNMRFMLIAPILMVAAMILPVIDAAIILVLTSASLISLPLFVSDPRYDVVFVTIITFSIGLLSLVLAWSNQRFNRRILEDEKRFRNLLDINTEGILIIDPDDGEIRETNTAIERILGYSRDELLGKFPITFVRSDFHEAVLQRWRKKSRESVEIVAQHKTGFDIYVEVVFQPYAYGEDQSHVLIIHDVTERRVVIEALQESEQRFSAIFNQAFQFICMLTTHGDIIELNDSILRFFDLERGAILGKEIWEINAFSSGEKGKKRLKDAVQHAADGSFIRYEATVRDKHGVKAFLDFSVKPIFSEPGQVSMLIAEARDVTANRLAESYRIENERRYRALFEHTADAVFLIDMNRTILSVNDQALKMFRCNQSDLIGKKTDEIIWEEDLDESIQSLNGMIQTELVDPVLERRLKRLDGEVFLAEISAMVVRDPDGNPQYLQSLVRDTSERYRLQQQQFELRLERERVAMLESFIEQASHHFRTPIANIKTRTYLLPRLNNSPEKQTEHLDVIQDEIKRLENLLNDLITVLRLQKGDSAFSINTLRLNHLLGEIRTHYESQSGYDQKAWTWHIDTPLEVLGDQQHITNAITILVHNAIRYTPEGQSIRIQLFGYQERWAVIEVKDSGMGIHVDDLPHIFDNFYRSHQAQSIDSSTTGLGLSICKQIVNFHSGTIRVESEIGQGTTFQVILPILDQWGAEPPTLPDGGLLVPEPQVG